MNETLNMKKSDPVILYCAADLIFATKIKATGDAIGVRCRPARSVDKLASLLTEEPSVAGLIVDLESEVDTTALIAFMREASPAVPVLAFGPHVATDKLGAAEAAGASILQARGSFAAQLPEILRNLRDGYESADHTG